jgi:hypothetical protein
MRAPRVVCVSVLCCVCLDAHTHVHVLSRSLTPLRTNKHKNKSNSDVCNITIMTYVDVCMLKYADINFNSSHPSGSVSCISTVESWTGVWCHDIFIPHRVSQRVIWLSFNADVCWRMLTYADVCWRMQHIIWLSHSHCHTASALLWHWLVYSDLVWHPLGHTYLIAEVRLKYRTLLISVCWRMLTYADGGEIAGSCSSSANCASSIVKIRWDFWKAS